MIFQADFGSIEAGMVGLRTLQALDENLKNVCFVRPKLKMLPSEYFRQNGFASFQELVGLDLAREHNLVDNA